MIEKTNTSSKSIEDILFKNGTIRPGSLEFMEFHKERITLKEIRIILYDASISAEVKTKLIKYLEPVILSDIKDILQDDTLPDLHRSHVAARIRSLPGDGESIKSLIETYTETSVIKELITKIPFIELDELQLLRQEISIPTPVYDALVGRIKPVPFSKIEPILLSNETHLHKGKLAEKVQVSDFSEVKDFIFNANPSSKENGMHFSFYQASIAKKVRSVDFHEISEFLHASEPENVEYIQSAISNRIKPVAFHEVQEILGNENIDYTVRTAIAKKLKPVTLAGAYGFLTDMKIQSYIRTKVAQELTPIHREDWEYFKNIVNEDPYVVYEVAQKIHFPKLDLKQFFKDEKTVRCYAPEINAHQKGLIAPTSREAIPTKRTLTLYFREEQGGFFPHMNALAPLLKKYTEGYSSVWNDLRIVNRHGKIAKLGGFSCQYPKGMQFRSICTIYADTIHTSHGTPEKGIPGTHFILGEAVRCDANKMTGINSNDYTSLPLLYYGGSSTDTVQMYANDTGSGFPLQDIEEIAKIFLETLRKAEKQILKNSGINPALMYSMHVSEKTGRIL